MNKEKVTETMVIDKLSAEVVCLFNWQWLSRYPRLSTLPVIMEVD